MSNKLYKVNVEVDVFVMAEGLAEAAKIARLHAGQEIPEFGLAHASEVESIYSIPEDWENTMPYSKDASEKRTCNAIMKASKGKAVEVKESIETPETPDAPPQKEHKTSLQTEELPVELPQNNDLPQLRFKI